MSRRKFLPLLRSLRSPGTLALTLAAVLASASAQTPAAETAASIQSAAAAAAKVARVTEPIDNATRVTFRGNVHPLAQAQYDRGAAPASMPTGRLSLLLRPSPVQEEALREYVDSLQNPASPSYHQWLTPASYGASYGVSEADIATVSAWLNAQGFKVEKVATARNIIQFSGTIGEVTSAFHTPIHSFVVNGEQHYANTVDPEIPAALAPAIKAISPLNNFRPRANHRLGKQARYNETTQKFEPELTLFDSQKNPFLFVGAADAATIYNTPNSNLNTAYHGTTYDGTGVTIGIAGDSDINMTDVANYRALFLHDSSTAHLPQQIIDGNDPGLNGDEIEALLDNEIVSALAPGANINFYTAEDAYLGAGLDLAIQRAIQDNNVSILNVSFGACEASLGVDGVNFYSSLWEQAAAQGITVTVSSGDSGSAACDDPNIANTAATAGLSVNGLASTPFDIAVGGTDYLLTTQNFSTYVQAQNSGQSPYYGTALGYIPETPWNDSINIQNGTISQNTDFLNSGDINISAAGGGASGFAYINNVGVTVQTAEPKPAFQGSLTPNDGVRDIPDVSFLAANGLHSALWALCSDNVANGDSSSTYTDCQLTNGVLNTNTLVDGVGGTSTAAPAFAGVLALVSQSLGSNVRLGQANTSIYKLASTLYSTVFHDVTTGNNSVPCAQGSANCVLDSASAYFLTGYNAGTGFDLASGLGSVNVANLVANWNTAGLLAPTVALTANGSTGTVSITHGQNVSFAVALTPSAATGDVSINTTSEIASNGSIQGATLGSNGTVTIPTNNLPGGSYSVYAYYGGNTTYAGAASNSITVNVGKENSTTSLVFNAADPYRGTSITNRTATYPYGSYAFADATPYGAASTNNSSGVVVPDGIPTGTVSFSGFGSTPTSVTLSSIGAAELPIITAAPGTYNVTAAYSGDTSFNSSSTTGTVTIVKAATDTQAINSANNLGGGQTETVTVAVGADSYGAYPTGSVTLTGNGSTFVQTGTPFHTSLNNGNIVVTEYNFTVAASQLVSGSNTLTATYSGDANYATSTNTTTINVTTTPSFTLAGPASGLTISKGSSGTAAITVAPVNGFSGAVALTCAVSSGAGTTPTCSLNPNSVTLSRASATSTLTISASSSSEVKYPLGRFFAAGGGVALGCVLLFGVPARRRSWQKMLATLCLLFGLGAIGLMGCGGSGSSSSGGGSTAHTYTATVTAAASGYTTQTTTVNVTVQ